ncbi:uncharacterized protein LOC126293256 [Schistocerca gregaria]|uniref:uncharacterized protein LOC126293256 n=1 Tax=Schistocerca gregaria TaxID=7010 RepID=UPI00211E0DE1|nr:uncharacterized protein LOC126293256 [Schistocerca gregaria]
MCVCVAELRGFRPAGGFAAGLCIGFKKRGRSRPRCAPPPPASPATPAGSAPPPPASSATPAGSAPPPPASPATPAGSAPPPPASPATPAGSAPPPPASPATPAGSAPPPPASPATPAGSAPPPPPPAPPPPPVSRNLTEQEEFRDQEWATPTVIKDEALSTDSQVHNCRAAGNPDAKRLYDDLLSNYNKLVRPVVNVSDALTVKIKLKLSQLIDVGQSPPQQQSPQLTRPKSAADLRQCLRCVDGALESAALGATCCDVGGPLEQRRLLLLLSPLRGASRRARMDT